MEPLVNANQVTNVIVSDRPQFCLSSQGQHREQHRWWIRRQRTLWECDSHQVRAHELQSLQRPLKAERPGVTTADAHNITKCHGTLRCIQHHSYTLFLVAVNDRSIVIISQPRPHGRDVQPPPTACPSTRFVAAVAPRGSGRLAGGDSAKQTTVDGCSFPPHGPPAPLAPPCLLLVLRCLPPLPDFARLCFLLIALLSPRC